MTDHKSRDRNLLFGVLAVQLRFITPQQLAEAAALWAATPDVDLAQVLVNKNYLSKADHDLITPLLDAQVKAHGGDPSASLAAFGGNRAVHESFAASIRLTADGVKPMLDSFGGAIKKSEGPSPTADQLGDREKITIEHPGRYTIKGEQGRGGIGRVMIAFDEHIGREVALKELLPDKAAGGGTPGQSPMRVTAEATVRFLREARITGQLEHPGIVPVYEIGKRGDDSVYYSMKLVRGKTLDEKIRECKSLQERLRLLPHFLDLCQAMAYAHSRGVIHRDLKPANVIIGEFGETVVLDWGLAKVKGLADEHAQELEKGLRLIKDAGAGETQVGEALGTPSYMSPEQAEGKIGEIDERSDVWSLGAILYEILTGRPPFTGTLGYEVIGKVMKDPVEPVSSVEKKAPPELAAICEKCLDKSPAGRYGNAGELSEDIAKFQSGGLVSSYEYSMGALARRWVGRHKPIVITATTALIILLIFGAWAFMRIRTQRNIAVQAKELAVQQRIHAEASEYETSETLAESYFILGKIHESKKMWEYAELYYAKSLTVNPTLEARYSLLSARSSHKYDIRRIADFTGSEDIHPASRVHPVFSPDGEKLAFHVGKNYQEYTNIAIWDLAGDVKIIQHENQIRKTADNAEERSIKNSNTTIETYETLEFSPCGKLLAAGNLDYSIDVWDVENQKVVYSMDQGYQGVKYIRFSPDGKILATADSRKVNLWDANTGLMLHSFVGEDRVNGIRDLDFSPDGTLLALSFHPGICQIWEVETGKLIHTLDPGFTFIFSVGFPVEFSPDGNVVAVGGIENDIYLWDTHTGAKLAVLKNHSSRVTTMIFCPNGYCLASASGVTSTFSSGSKDDREVISKADNSIHVWNVQHGRYLWSMEGHENSITKLVLSPTRNEVISFSLDGTLKMWSLYRLGHEIQSFQLPKNNYDVFYSGNKFAVINNNTLSVYELYEKSEREVYIGNKGYDNLEFSEKSGFIAAASKHTPVSTIDTQTGQLLRKFIDGHEYVRSVAFNPTGDKLLTTGEDGKAILWNLEDASSALILYPDPETKNADMLLAGAISPDGKKIVAAGCDERDSSKECISAKIHQWDADTGTLKPSLQGHSDFILFLSYSPDGRMLASGSGDGSISLWNAETGELKNTFREPGHSVKSVCFTPDGNLLVSGGMDDKVIVWDLKNGTKIRTLNAHNADVFAVAVSPDGRKIASASLDGTVKIWGLKNGARIKTFEEQKSHFAENGFMAAAFSPDGEYIAAAGKNKRIYVWNVDTGAQVNHSNITSHSGLIRSLAFSPDGQYLASGSRDSTAKIWEAGTWHLKTTLGDDEYSDKSFALSRDGKNIAISYRKGRGIIKLYDVATGNKVVDLKSHTKPPEYLTFSENGKKLITVSSNEAVMWNLADGNSAIKLKEKLRDPKCDANGKIFSLIDHNNMLLSWDMDSGETISEIPLEGSDNSHPVVSPTSNIVALSKGPWNKKSIDLYDIEKGDTVYSFSSITNQSPPMFTPDGKFMATGGPNDSIFLLDMKSRNLKKIESAGKLLDFSPDSKLMITSVGIYDIEVTNIIINFSRNLFESELAKIKNVKFSPDGKRLVFIDDEERMVIWNLDTTIIHGEPETILREYENRMKIKVISTYLYPWNPKTGEISENHLELRY